MRSRVATAADVAAILTMMVDFNRHEAIAFDPKQGEPILRELIARPDLGCVLVFEEDRMIGYAVLTYGFDLEFGGRDGFLTEIFLVEDARGKGHGKEALDRVIEAAKANGMHAIHLQVRHDNPNAKKLYEKSGFEAPERTLMTKLLG